MNPDGTVSSSLLKTLLQGEDAHEEDEVSLASTEHAAGDEASRSVAEEEEEDEGKIAGERKKQLDPQSPCRLLCERHCASEATPRVAEPKKRKRKKQTDEEETQTKKRKKRQQRVSCCCPFAASKTCCHLEGDHIRRCFPMFCMPM